MGLVGQVRVLVLLAAGINCDRETALAFELVGARADRVHVNDIISQPQLLGSYHILVLPGGFSFGDDIASGQVLARKLKYRLEAQLEQFVGDGKLVLGICNGFQVLVKMGLLPGGHVLEQQAALTFNISDKFEDRWVYLDADSNCESVFTRGLKDPIYLPVRHGEGRFVIKDSALTDLKNNGQVALRYVDDQGKSGGYPINPNGSIDDIAGICDPTGRIFGLMPHPEVFVRTTQHPRWSRGEGNLPDGIGIFANAVKFAAKI